MRADPVPSPETTGTGETRTACEVCEDFAACQQSRGCTLSGAWEAEYAAALAMVQDAGNTVIPNGEYRRLVDLAAAPSPPPGTRTDAERLNWLATGNEASSVPDGYLVWSGMLDATFRAAGLRDAIDAAMSAERAP